MLTKFRPSRPTLLALLLGAGSWGVQIFDWFQRGSVVDTWLVTNRTTMLGHGLIGFVDNAWAITIFALFFWWHDVDLRTRLDQNYPKFVASIFEAQISDPVVGPDLFSALIVSIANSGMPSVTTLFKVSARTVFGADIKVAVFSNPSFTMYFNGAKDCIDYTEEHYIMDRTHNTPVKRGVPVKGVLPCVFHGITDPKSIDWLSLKVSFADGTGDANGQVKWWETAPLTSLDYSEETARRVRPGLPTLHPVGQK
jgi:hypothetical protein